MKWEAKTLVVIKAGILDIDNWMNILSPSGSMQVGDTYSNYSLVWLKLIYCFKDDDQKGAMFLVSFGSVLIAESVSTITRLNATLAT